MIGTYTHQNSHKINLIGFSRAQPFIKEHVLINNDINDEVISEHHIEDGHKHFVGNKLFASPFSLNDKK